LLGSRLQTGEFGLLEAAFNIDGIDDREVEKGVQASYKLVAFDSRTNNKRKAAAVATAAGPAANGLQKHAHFENFLDMNKKVKGTLKGAKSNRKKAPTTERRPPML